MAMTTRFCPRCETDVQDAGGYCLLGHPLALKPLDASLGDLRAEIDQAFEDARLEVAAVVSGTEITQPMQVVSRTAPPPPPPAAVTAPPRPRRAGPPPPPPRAPRPVVEQVATDPQEILTEIPATQEAAIEATPAAPEAFLRPVPTSPEGPVEPTPDNQPDLDPAALVDAQDFPVEDDVLARKFPVWQELEEASPLVGDPIGAFAPPPHMDWGPEKTKPKLLKRKPSRLRKGKRED